MSNLRLMASTPPSVAPISPPPHQQKRIAIPGSYGWPVIGPLVDRLNYFWFDGPANYYKKKMDKYKSTVFRTNVPPTFPFFGGVNPNVVALLDVESFAHLFDMEIVEKANVLVGDFMPSVKYTGGVRVCAYLDTAETPHAQVKEFTIDILKRSAPTWVSSMVTSLDPMLDSFESQLSSSDDPVGLFLPIQKFLFSFLCRSILGAETSTVPEIHNSGHIMIDKWLVVQLGPIIPINAIQPLEEILLHSFSYPFWLVQSDYNKLTDFVRNQAKETLNRARTEFKLTEEQAIHNLLFILGFNAFGGFSIFLIALLGNLGDQKSIHHELRKEVREKLSNGSDLSFETVQQMDLINSFVYETLRLSPPVPSQFARARKNFDLSSHDAVFEIKKGELLCGYQPIVMQDPKIFDNPSEFVYDRFTKGKGGDELLKYLFWSNGPQTGSSGPTVGNKQCAARDAVPRTAAIFLAYLFQRYDEIEISSGNITALKKAAK